MKHIRLPISICLLLVLMVDIFPDVVNKDKPQHGEWDFKLEKVWEIDSAGDAVLGRPQGMLVSDDGILYLSDEANRIDYIFGPDGDLIGSFAARGEGPGEVLERAGRGHRRVAHDSDAHGLTVTSCWPYFGGST